jgi:hypothetical protein
LLNGVDSVTIALLTKKFHVPFGDVEGITEVVANNTRKLIKPSILSF